MGNFLAILLVIAVFALLTFSFYIQIIGTILCFRKRWYTGLAAICFPTFGFVVGAASVLFKKDLLK